MYKVRTKSPSIGRHIKSVTIMNSFDLLTRAIIGVVVTTIVDIYFYSKEDTNKIPIVYGVLVTDN